MGQKVNPILFRISNSKKWDSVWFDSKKKSYSDKLVNDVKIRDFIRSQYAHCGIGTVVIERASDKVNVIIKTSKPGVLIGKRGLDIGKIVANIREIAKCVVEVKIVEIEVPDANASLVAQSIARQLEGRAAFKKIMKKSIQSALKCGVGGIKICCSGRLGGAEIARTEWYKDGSVPLHTIRSDIDYSIARAYTTYGVIGVKVWICKGLTEKRA